MNFKKIIITTIVGLLPLAVSAKPPIPPNKIPNEKVKDCTNSFDAITAALPQVAVPDLFKTQVKESQFCVDYKMYNVSHPKQKDLLETYKLLDVSGVIDNNGCIVEGAKEGVHASMISKFMKENLENMPVNMMIGVDDKSETVRLNLSVQSEKKFETTKLSTTDKWQIAGLSTAGIVAGALVSEAMYKGQADKRKHWMVGAAISGASTGTAYLLLETAGLGDRLGMSAKEKKRAILFAGPIMGTIAGILKEVYDDRNRKKHTVDANDAAATSLGAGGVVPLVIQFTF